MGKISEGVGVTPARPCLAGRYETILDKEKEPMNLEREINIKHKKMMGECLEEVEDKIVGYDIKIN